MNKDLRWHPIDFKILVANCFSLPCTKEENLTWIRDQESLRPFFHFPLHLVLCKVLFYRMIKWIHVTLLVKRMMQLRILFSLETVINLGKATSTRKIYNPKSWTIFSQPHLHILPFLPVSLLASHPQSRVSRYVHCRQYNREIERSKTFQVHGTMIQNGILLQILKMDTTGSFSSAKTKCFLA